MHDGLVVGHAGEDGVVDSHGLTLAVPNEEGGTDVFEDGKLVYAEEGYPDYKVYEIANYDITCVR